MNIDNFLKSDFFFIILLSLLFILIMLFIIFYISDKKKNKNVNSINNLQDKNETIPLDLMELPKIKTEEKEKNVFDLKPDGNREINDNIEIKNDEYIREKTEIFILPDFLEDNQNEKN